MKGFCTFSSLGRYGRFANQIYQIAGTIGIARKNGLEPVFPLWCNYDHAERFGSTEDINVYQHFINELPGVLGSDLTSYNKVGVAWGYHNVHLPEPGNYDIYGHLQSRNYFAHCIDEVRKVFTMKKEEKKIYEVVAIHARRGDYDNKYHPVIPVSYYVLAITKFSKTASFFVFSDDNNFIYQLKDALNAYGLHEQAKNLIPIHGDYLSCFAIMKRCRHFIIGNSSYSAAAAMLCEGVGTVVAPKNWFGPAYTNISAKDIYCDNWIIL
jgi:hypothetical protein